MSDKSALCDTTRLLDGQIRPWDQGYQLYLMSHNPAKRGEVAANSLGGRVGLEGFLRAILERVPR